MHTIVQLLRDDPPPVRPRVRVGIAVVGVLLIVVELWLVAEAATPERPFLRGFDLETLGVVLLGISFLAAPVGLAAMATASVLAAVVSAPTDSAVVVALLLPWMAFFAARHLRTGALIFFTVGHLVASIASAVLSPEFWLTLPIAILGLAAGLALGLFTRRLGLHVRHAQESSVLAYERQERALATLRRSMARDLHDVVAQNLSVIALQAEASRYITDRAQQAGVLETVASTARQTHTDLRGLLDVLYASTGGDQPVMSSEADLADVRGTSLTQGVERSVARLRDQGFTVHERVALPDASAVPRSVQTTMDRILQEASTNVAKHAPAGADIELDVRLVGTQLRLHMVNDLDAHGDPGCDGAGHAGAALRGPGVGAYGLVNIGERAQLLGGHAELGPQDGRWHVRVDLPIRH